MSGTVNPLNPQDFLGGLLGNQSLVSPTNPQGLLGIARAQQIDPSLAVAPTPQAAPAPPQAPQTALGAVTDWANAMNKNAYGYDPTTAKGQQALGILGSQGFPLMNDPRLIQGRLADMVQGNVPLPKGVSMQDVQDEFWRQLYGRGRGAGLFGADSGMGGDTAETAAAAAEHEESAAAAGGGGSNLYG